MLWPKTDTLTGPRALCWELVSGHRQLNFHLVLKSTGSRNGTGSLGQTRPMGAPRTYFRKHGRLRRDPRQARPWCEHSGSERPGPLLRSFPAGSRRDAGWQPRSRPNRADRRRRTRAHVGPAPAAVTRAGPSSRASHGDAASGPR